MFSDGDAPAIACLERYSEWEKDQDHGSHDYRNEGYQLKLTPTLLIALLGVLNVVLYVSARRVRWEICFLPQPLLGLKTNS